MRYRKCRHAICESMAFTIVCMVTQNSALRNTAAYSPRVSMTAAGLRCSTRCRQSWANWQRPPGSDLFKVRCSPKCGVSELLNLSWDSGGDPRIEKLGDTWIVRFSRESQKSNEDQLWAMPPRFEKLLSEIPEDERAGSVFSLARANGRKSVFTEEWVSNTVTKIGRTAGIVVATHPIRKTKKYASLHDLRRTFATWWARRVPATILRELMRQESVQTTEDYYVGINAQAMAIVLKAIDGPCPENIGVTNQLTLDRLPFTPLVET